MDRYVTEPEYIFPCMRGFWRAGYKGTHAVPKFQVYRTQPKVRLHLSRAKAKPTKCHVHTVKTQIILEDRLLSPSMNTTPIQTKSDLFVRMIF